MSELFSAVSGELYDKASVYARYCVEKCGVERCDLWKHLLRFIDEARKEYASVFVDWFAPRHIELAQRELADSIIADLWEAD